MQNEIMNEAKANMAEWPNKTVFIKNFTSLAVHHVPGLVDFIYVDARHDYCGVGVGVRGQGVQCAWEMSLESQVCEGRKRWGGVRSCLVEDCLHWRRARSLQTGCGCMCHYSLRRQAVSGAGESPDVGDAGESPDEGDAG